MREAGTHAVASVNVRSGCQEQPCTIGEALPSRPVQSRPGGLGRVGKADPATGVVREGSQEAREGAWCWTGYDWSAGVT